MRTDELDYSLPPQAVATRPAEPRDHSRLMVVRRALGAAGTDVGRSGSWQVEHARFFELPGFFKAGDLLVTNNTRVLPAKLLLHRQSGGSVQALFVRELAVGLWEMLVRTRGKVRPGETLVAPDAQAPTHRFTLHERVHEGLWHVRVEPAEPAEAILQTLGRMPIPPYIEKARKAQNPESGLPGEHGLPAEFAGIANAADYHDETWYQTAYATGSGQSVAAPTAGLHFTPELLETLRAQGVRRAAVELDVGPGTFLPVETATLEEHAMHSERYRVPAETAAAIRAARRNGQRIGVVGTTAVRTLESAAEEILGADGNAGVGEIAGETALKIMPPFDFRLTDVLLTNFHLPRSTLMALVAAFLTRPGAPDGLAELKHLYALAVNNGYRFYSYGDAMLILP